MALRLAVDELTDTSFYTDDYLSDMIDGVGQDSAAADIWAQKAAKYAALVDISEGGSSRKNSDLQVNALRMSALYSDRVAAAEQQQVAAAMHTGVRISKLSR